MAPIVCDTETTHAFAEPDTIYVPWVMPVPEITIPAKREGDPLVVKAVPTIDVMVKVVEAGELVIAAWAKGVVGTVVAKPIAP
jgi:hypothetical protein